MRTQTAPHTEPLRPTEAATPQNAPRGGNPYANEGKRPVMLLQTWSADA